MADEDRAFKACFRAGDDPAQGIAVEDLSFHIGSGEGTVHSPHWDAHGLATCIWIREGYKLFVFYWSPLEKLDSLVPIPSDREDSLWRLAEQPGLVRSEFVAGPDDHV